MFFACMLAIIREGKGPPHTGAHFTSVYLSAKKLDRIIMVTVRKYATVERAACGRNSLESS